MTTSLAGEHEFVVRGRGGFRHVVDGETIMDSWTPGADERAIVRRVGATHRLAGYTKLPFVLEHTQGDGPAEITLAWIPPQADAGTQEALAAANDADAIIFVGGLSAQLEGEEMEVPYTGFAGGDCTRIELPQVQLDLLQKLHATGKPIVFVTMSGCAIAMPWIAGNIPAILQAWYPGQDGGTAVADVMQATTNPPAGCPSRSTARPRTSRTSTTTP